LPLEKVLESHPAAECSRITDREIETDLTSTGQWVSAVNLARSTSSTDVRLSARDHQRSFLQSTNLDSFADRVPSLMVIAAYDVIADLEARPVA